MKPLIVCLLLLYSLACHAAEKVQVLALFPGKAMLQIDGKRKVLSQGQSHAGVELLSATPESARVSIDGQERDLRLGTSVSASYWRASRRELRLLRDGEAFFVNGLINGRSVRMLVDTGATLVAISETQARSLGIPYVTEGSQTTVGTASGLARAYSVRLRSLNIGDFSFSNIEAAVVQGDFPRQVLLGMNVLNRLDIEHRSNLMILRSKH